VQNKFVWLKIDRGVRILFKLFLASRTAILNVRMHFMDVTLCDWVSSSPFFFLEITEVRLFSSVHLTMTLRALCSFERRYDKPNVTSQKTWIFSTRLRKSQKP